MRWLIHVEDASEMFVRFALVDSSRNSLYNSSGTEQSDIYLVDNSRMREEFEVELPPYRQRVLEINNEVRQAEGMALISE